MRLEERWRRTVRDPIRSRFSPWRCRCWRAPWHLIAPPFLWCLVAGATAWVPEAPVMMILPATGVLAALLIAVKNRQTTR